ncbi:MAG: SRPBCC family protein [Pseudorhizobium sp.]
MNPEPTGQVVGNHLILTRTFNAPLNDVWASITNSESTARWFGPWEGDAGPGNVVRLKLVHEKSRPWIEVTIEECEAPRHLILLMKDKSGDWRLDLTLTQAGDTTTLRFVQHLSDPKLAGDVGPGWEYYLDMLVAAREGKALPLFDDYYPAQKTYYLKGASR